MASINNIEASFMRCFYILEEVIWTTMSSSLSARELPHIQRLAGTFVDLGEGDVLGVGYFKVGVPGCVRD